MIEIVRNTNIDFLGKRYIAYAISGALVLLGLFAFVQISTGKANLGIDFAGGTAVQVKFERRVPLGDVRKTLVDGELEGFDLQEFPEVNKILVRVKGIENTLGDVSNKIVQILEEGFADNPLTVESTTEIGPKVGKRLKKDALWAVIMATLFILAYIAWRFQFKFGVGATAATFHDVLAVLGIFFLMGREINLILISALLTIAGYSLTDTVVVFDRVRENMKRRGRGDTVIEIMNRSVNEVLSRTLVTSITTLMAATALFIAGGSVVPEIYDFSLAIILGILVGTYSSVFVASPIVLAWEGITKKR